MNVRGILVFLLFAFLLFGCVRTQPAVLGGAVNDTLIPGPSALAGELAPPYEGGLAFDSFVVSLEVDGKSLDFKETGRKKLADQTTPYGLADTTIINSRAGEITRETKIWALKEFNGTYLIQHAYDSSGPSLVVTRSVAFSAVMPKAAGARLYYGPADGTMFMEDYVNIPVVDGYSKRGSMLYGGVPLNYAWNGQGGIAVGVLADTPGSFELPLEVTAGVVRMGVRFTPQGELGQKTLLAPGNRYETETVFISFNKGDFFRPLDRYAKLLEQATGKKIQNIGAPAWVKKPYWKTWGLNSFDPDILSKEEIRKRAKELKELGIGWIMLDWGWFNAEGDWSANKAVFESDGDLEAFLHELKQDGFRVGLWFQPLQINPENDFVRKNLLQYAVRNKDGTLFIDDDGLALLDPAAPEVRNYVLAQFKRFARLGVEHVYLDSQIAQVYSPPNYSRSKPLASHEALADLYVMMRKSAEENNMVTEICPDGRSQTILNMPQHINNIGDPKNYRQLRAKFKSLKAILGSRAIVGAYLEDPFENDPEDYRQDSESLSNRENVSFASIVGLGGQLQTYFRSVDDFGKDNWKKWLNFYAEQDVVSGEYLDLYDIAFDYPEGHVVKKGDKLYYSFFTQTDGLDACLKDYCEPGRMEDGKPRKYEGRIELRGLRPNKEYDVARFPEGVTRSMTTDKNGRITLNEAFEKEAVFVVVPGVRRSAGGFELRTDGAFRVTDGPGSDQNPAFLDDNTLVFTRFSAGYNAGPAALMGAYLGNLTEFVIWEDGAQNVNVNGNPFTPDRKQLCYSSDIEDTDEVWCINLATRQRTRVTANGRGLRFFEPSVSADSRRIVFEAHDATPAETPGRLWVSDFSGALSPLLADSSDNRLPMFNPYNGKVLFQRNSGSGWRLFVREENGALKELGIPTEEGTDASWASASQIVYSADGKDLLTGAYLAYPKIYSYDVATERGRQETSAGFEDGAPAVSPSGRLLAFESHAAQGADSPASIWVVARK